MNFYDAIFFQAALDPLRPALAYVGGLATYGMVARSANVAAANIANLGVRAGDLCTIRIRDPLLHLLVLIGLGRIGAAALSLADVKRLDDFGLTIAASFIDAPIDGDKGDRIHVVDASFYAESAAPNPYGEQIKGYRGDKDHLLAVCMSSGTTGRPKAVGLTNDILFGRAGAMVAGRTDNRSLSLMGFDTFGGYWNAMQALRLGGTLCFAPQGPSVLEMASFFSVTEIIASPLQALSLVSEQRLRARTLPALRSIVIGGAQLPSDVQIEMERCFSAQIMIVYGSTETGIMTVAPSLMNAPGARTCGFPLPWLEIEVVDESGVARPAGEDGAIRARGPGVIAHYLSPSEEDEAMFRDGWFYPGDIGRLDENNLLHVTGRSGTRINRGGFKIAPETIEEALAAHPGLRDCAAAGLEAADGRMLVLVAIVPQEAGVSDESLRAYCQARIPDCVPDEFLRVPAIPRNSLGKIAREDLRIVLRRAYSS